MVGPNAVIPEQLWCWLVVRRTAMLIIAHVEPESSIAEVFSLNVPVTQGEKYVDAYFDLPTCLGKRGTINLHLHHSFLLSR